MLVSKTIGQSSNLCLPAKNIILERATCKEQGLPAKQIVHLVWIGVGIQPLRKDCINTAYDKGRTPN